MSIPSPTTTAAPTRQFWLLVKQGVGHPHLPFTWPAVAVALGRLYFHRAALLLVSGEYAEAQDLYQQLDAMLRDSSFKHHSTPTWQSEAPFTRRQLRWLIHSIRHRIIPWIGQEVSLSPSVSEAERWRLGVIAISILEIQRFIEAYQQGQRCRPQDFNAWDLTLLEAIRDADLYPPEPKLQALQQRAEAWFARMSHALREGRLSDRQVVLSLLKEKLDLELAALYALTPRLAK